MLKVLIVDDEHMIREGLKTIIDWGRLGFEVCDTAVNGREGLQKAGRHNPDLVIADIRMPVMDGLAMVEEMKARGYEGNIIILSAHSDFGFAQRSIELGIDSYVLKPVEQDDLIQKVNRVKALIESRNESRQNIDDSILLSRGKILEGFVTGVIPESMLEKYKKQYNLDFPWMKYQVGLIDFGKENIPAPKLRKEIRGQVENYIAQNSYGYVIDLDGYIGILLRNICEMQLPRILMRLQSAVYSENRIRVTISVGNPVESLGMTSRSYMEAQRLLEQKFLLGHKQIIISSEGGDIRPEAGAGEPCRFNTEDALNSLQNAIDVNHSSLMNDLLEEMKDSFIRCGCDEKVIKINYTGLYLTLIGRISAAEEPLNVCGADSKEVLDEIGKKTSLQELHGYMKLQLFSIAERLCRSRPTGTMKRILDYIDRNYGREIKLESLATMFCYNSTYLGKLFKSQTGESFNSYLDRVRLEKAKQLLGKGLKIYQVVEMVGIHDIDYFYRKFKRYTGTSPSAFKRKAGCSEL